MVTKRKFLMTIASVGATAAVAGCSAVDDIDLSGQGPEDAVEQYFTALSDGEVEAANDAVHESWPEISDDELDSETITIVELYLEEMSVRELIETEHDPEDDELEEAVADIQAEIDDELDEIGAEDHAVVSYTVTFEEDEREETDEGMFLLVEEDGEWLLYANSLPSLSSPAEATGEETQQQVSNRLQIQSATGSVTETAGDNVVDEVNVTVTKSPGSDDISLGEVSYEFVTDDVTETDLIDTSQIDIISGTDDNEITDRSDRYQLVFDATDHIGGPIQEGETARLTLTTAEGASTVTELRVPDDLDDRGAVSL